MTFPTSVDISMGSLFLGYSKMQSTMMAKMQSVAANMSGVNPGQFILLQFQMSQVSQVGEAISNIVSALNKVISNAVGNMRGG